MLQRRWLLQLWKVKHENAGWTPSNHTLVLQYLLSWHRLHCAVLFTFTDPLQSTATWICSGISLCFHQDTLKAKRQEQQQQGPNIVLLVPATVTAQTTLIKSETAFSKIKSQYEICYLSSAMMSVMMLHWDQLLSHRIVAKLGFMAYLN